MGEADPGLVPGEARGLDQRRLRGIASLGQEGLRRRRTTTACQTDRRRSPGYVDDSDIDFVAVLSRVPDSNDLTALNAAHATVREAAPFPPLTMIRALGLPLRSAFVAPSAIASCIFSTSARRSFASCSPPN